MNKDDNAASALGCLAALISLPIGALWTGYALSVLWGWFIVPTFEARPLGVVPAIGLALVVSFLTKQYDTYIDKDKSATERTVIGIVYTFIYPAFALGFGWIVHLFM